MFRALADPTRRALLDALFDEDGQTLVALTAGHDMTRIGVAKHLGVLEDAGLVVSRRRGREKRHFLNPVPIRLVHRGSPRSALTWSSTRVTYSAGIEVSATICTDLLAAVVHDGQRLHPPAVGQLVEQEVHAPHLVGLLSAARSGWRSGTGSFLRRRLRTIRPSSR